MIFGLLIIAASTRVSKKQLVRQRELNQNYRDMAKAALRHNGHEPVTRKWMKQAINEGYTAFKQQDPSRQTEIDMRVSAESVWRGTSTLNANGYKEFLNEKPNSREAYNQYTGEKLTTKQFEKLPTQQKRQVAENIKEMQSFESKYNYREVLGHSNIGRKVDPKDPVQLQMTFERIELLNKVLEHYKGTIPDRMKMAIYLRIYGVLAFNRLPRERQLEIDLKIKNNEQITINPSEINNSLVKLTTAEQGGGVGYYRTIDHQYLTYFIKSKQNGKSTLEFLTQ